MANPGVILIGEKTLNPKVTLELKVSEINRINELIERNEPKAIVVKEYESFTSITCPVCGQPALKAYQFCAYCGQRLDQDNIAL